jgi:DNA-binding transcriptional LysR family regulator
MNIDVRLSQLRQLLLVDETRSYLAAARQAYRSQPALSQAVHQLESRLGAAIFEKGSRATLTPFGERCLPILREALSHMESSLATVMNIAAAAGGSLSFAILPSVAQEWLPWLLGEFNGRHPNVKVRVLAHDSLNVERLVAEGQVDFGISSSPADLTKLAFRPLVRDQFGLLCRNDHEYARARTLRWDKLQGEPILGSMMHRILQGTEVAPLLSDPAVYVSNLPTLVSLVRNRVGVVPMPALAFPVSEPGLAFVPLVAPVQSRTIGILSLHNRSLFPAAQAMVDLLLKGLRSRDWNSRARHAGLGRMIRQVR